MNSQIPSESKICGAKTRSGKPCQKPPIVGRTRCRLHGGASPRGKDHPRTRHGRWSRDVPTRLAARYAQAELDPRLCDLSADIALLETRAAELLARVEQKDSDAFRQKALESWEAIEFAARSGDAESLQSAMVNHGRLLHRGASDVQCWRELVLCLEKKSALTMAEHKRQVDLEVMLPMAQASALFVALVESLRRRIKNETTLAQIRADFDAICGRRLDSPMNGNVIDADAGPPDECSDDADTSSALAHQDGVPA